MTLNFKLTWTPASKSNSDCPYNHSWANTPFGKFLITWKGWKDYPSYDADVPWGVDPGAYGHPSLEEAQLWCEKQYNARLNTAPVTTNDFSVEAYPPGPIDPPSAEWSESFVPLV